MDLPILSHVNQLVKFSEIMMASLTSFDKDRSKSPKKSRKQQSAKNIELS